LSSDSNVVRQLGLKNATPAQIVLVWLMAQTLWIVPIPRDEKAGASRQINFTGRTVQMASLRMGIAFPLCFGGLALIYAFLAVRR
jgi:hypothetical protein